MARKLKKNQGKHRAKNLTSIKSLFSEYACKAQARNKDWNIELAYFTTLIQQPCAYCGVESSNERRGFKYNGIDRVRNNEGYTKENSVACCRRCNQIKSNVLSGEEMLAAIKGIKRFFPKF